jgi:hypothetical protein
MKAKLSIAAGAALLVAALQAAAAPLPQPITRNGVTYLNGGIGHDEALAMRAEARRYPLSIVFSAGKDNEFLADVKVAIKNKAGKQVLSDAAAGPIMLVKLPAGNYAIAAERDGMTLHRTVRVGDNGHERVNFHWPSA